MPDPIKKNDDGTITVTLKAPVEHNKETISAITLRGQATVADLESMDKYEGQVRKTLVLITELATEPAALSLTFLRGLPASDYANLNVATLMALGALGN